MPNVDPAELSAFTEEMLLAVNAPSDVARTVADALVEADLHGHHSHGVRLVRTYVERIRKGMIDPTGRPEVVQETPTSMIVDGRSGFGQNVGQRTIEKAIPKAAENGISIVGIRNATHLGCIGTWARRTAAENLAFLGFVCNPTSTYVAPAGLTEGRLSTNPLAMGLPSFDALPYPLVLDMATSQVAFGKIWEAEADGEEIPEEWAAPTEGNTDPATLSEGSGALAPLGGTVSGYKGFGMAVMIELLASNMADTPVSGQEEAEYGNSAMFVFIDPLAFTTEARLEDRITAFRDYVFSEEPPENLSPGYAAVGDTLLLPGEPEYVAKTEQSETGVEIRSADARSLRELASELSVEDVPEPLRADR